MKITDTQTAVLTAAAARPDGAILPLPGAYPRWRHRQGVRRSGGQGPRHQRRPARQADPRHQRRWTFGARPRNQARSLSGEQADGGPRRDEAGAARRKCSRRRKVPAPPRSSPPSAGSPTRSAERSPARSRRGLACRSGPRRSRVADASTGSCRNERLRVCRRTRSRSPARSCPKAPVEVAARAKAPRDGLGSPVGKAHDVTLKAEVSEPT